jgi:hypothetical protein
VVSPGTQQRIFTHVDDIVDALMLVGERGTGDGYGIGGEHVTSIIELARLFDTDIVMLPERQGNRMVASIDSSKTREMGWMPKHSLQDDITAFVASTEPAPVQEKRIMVFSTTFHPVAGPAERALTELMESMPSIHFDIVTAAYTKEACLAPASQKNWTAHRVGNGTRFDKYLLAVVGIRTTLQLAREHRYMFAWSVMASYGTLPALALRLMRSTPLLVTLADQSIAWYERLFLRLVLTSADQVYASLPEQGKSLVPLERRMRMRKSLGAGDTFANQVRFAYSVLLRRALSRKKQ